MNSTFHKVNSEVYIMLNLDDLSIFVAFYNYGTLTRVAEEFHISQPTLTRTMKRVEDSFGVSLFTRTANRLEFNEIGEKAVVYAEELLKQAEQCQKNVIEYEKALHSLTIISCAPAPLWDLIPKLSRKNIGKTISSRLVSDLQQIEEDFRSYKCDIAVLPYPIKEDGIESTFFVEEHLYLSVPKNHELAKYKEITAEIINGYNCLLSPEIGFWENFCKTKLPNSKFLVQNDEFAFLELIKESNLPCFATNLSEDRQESENNRILIPITDAEANVKFYLVKHK